MRIQISLEMMFAMLVALALALLLSAAASKAHASFSSQISEAAGVLGSVQRYYSLLMCRWCTSQGV